MAMSFVMPLQPKNLTEKVLSGLPWDVCLLHVLEWCHSPLSGISRSNSEAPLLQASIWAWRTVFSSRDAFPSLTKWWATKGHLLSWDRLKLYANYWPFPWTAKYVKSFLGLCSYYWHFVWGLVDSTTPLYKLTDDQREFQPESVKLHVVS